MSDTEEVIEEIKEEVKGNTFCAWIKGLGIKIKVFFIALFGIVGTVLFFVLSKNTNTKDILKLELKKVRKEIEIENAAKEIDKNNEKISDLESRAAQIKEEIAEIEKIAPENAEPEDLDDFFDNRGF